MEQLLLLKKRKKYNPLGGVLSHPRSDAGVYRVVLGADGVR